MANQISKEEARQGTPTRRILVVLIISTIAAGLSLGLIQLYFAFDRDTGDGRSGSTIQEQTAPENPGQGVAAPGAEPSAPPSPPQ